MSSAPSADLLAAVIAGGPAFIAGHVTPDADCLSSMFAMSLGIEQATGQRIPVALPDGSVAGRVQFLVDWAQPAIADAATCAAAQLAIVCDTAKGPRTNMPAGLTVDGAPRRTIVNIDHHASNTQFGTINWVDAHASSTAELITRLYQAAGWTLTPTVASLLYSGIHSDTVGFSLPSTSQSSLAAAADLVAAGAEVGRVGELLCRSRSQREFDLRRVIYDNTRLSISGRIAFSTANHHEITRAGCTAEDIDDQVEIPRSLKQARIAILFTEGIAGKIRMNFRGEESASILELAQSIGGGGHRLAAGAIITGSIEDAVQKVIPLTEQYLDKLERGQKE